MTSQYQEKGEESGKIIHADFQHGGNSHRKKRMNRDKSNRLRVGPDDTVTVMERHRSAEIPEVYNVNQKSAAMPFPSSISRSMSSSNAWSSTESWISLS